LGGAEAAIFFSAALWAFAFCSRGWLMGLWGGFRFIFRVISLGRFLLLLSGQPRSFGNHFSSGHTLGVFYALRCRF